MRDSKFSRTSLVPKKSRLRLEQLEDRLVPSTVLFQSSLDDLPSVESPWTGLGGTIRGNPEFVPGKSGQGLKLDDPGEVLELPITESGQHNVDWTRGEIEFWYRPNYAPQDDDVIHSLVMIGGVYDVPRISVTESDVLAISITDTGWTSRSAGSSWRQPLWQAGEWVHIRANWDSTAQTDALQLFVNGTRIDDGSASGPWNMGTYPRNSLFVGAANRAGIFSADGVIDELIIRSEPSSLPPDTGDPGEDPDPGDPPADPGNPPADPGNPPGNSPGITDPTRIVPLVTMPKPQPGVPFIDPSFGTTVVRVSDASDHGRFESHIYSQLQAFSVGNEYLLLTGSNGYVVRRMSDFSLVENLNTSTWNAARWHPTQPHTIVHFDTNADTDVTLQFTNVETGITTDIYTLPTEYRYLRVSESHEELSHDGRWLAGMATRADGETAIFTLDIENRQLGATTTVSELYATHCSVDPVWGMVEPNWVGVSPLGNYLMIHWTREGTQRCSGVEAYDIRTGEFVGRAFGGRQHGDLGVLPDGQTEVYMTFALAGPVPYNGQPAIAMHRVPDTASPPEFLQIMDWGNTEHISCRGPNGQCVVTAGTRASNGWNAFEGEVFIQNTDGTVLRLAHHHSSSANYWVQPRASISRDGRYVVFTSDWSGGQGGPGLGDSYVIDLQAGGSNQNSFPSIVTTDIPEGMQNDEYDTTLVAANGDGLLTWMLVDGKLPNGVTLAMNGYLQGIPTEAGLFTFTVEVADVDGDRDTRTFILFVIEIPNEREGISGILFDRIRPARVHLEGRSLKSRFIATLDISGNDLKGLQRSKDAIIERILNLGESFGEDGL